MIMRAFVVLTPSESKRLIARAVARKREVRTAMEKAYVILCEGTTTTYVAQELFGADISCAHFTSGMNMSGVLCNSDRSVRGRFPLVAYNGKLVDVPYEKALDDFHKETVIIKGANAIDHSGFVGIITSGYTGGSIAKVIGTSVSQGLRIICPVGLEKTIFSVVEAAKRTGGKRFDYAMGADFGLFVLTNADIVTELQAIRILFGADATPVASGGVDGSEGAVVLAIEGEEKPVREAVRSIESIKGEPAQKGVRMKCPGQTAAAGEPRQCKYVNCTFYPRDNPDLPLWLHHR
jgi:hypothetical protein